MYLDDTGKSQQRRSVGDAKKHPQLSFQEESFDEQTSQEQNPQKRSFDDEKQPPPQNFEEQFLDDQTDEQNIQKRSMYGAEMSSAQEEDLEGDQTLETSKRSLIGALSTVANLGDYGLGAALTFMNRFGFYGITPVIRFGWLALRLVFAAIIRLLERDFAGFFRLVLTAGLSLGRKLAYGVYRKGRTFKSGGYMNKVTSTTGNRNVVSARHQFI